MDKFPLDRLEASNTKHFETRAKEHPNEQLYCKTAVLIRHREREPFKLLQIASFENILQGSDLHFGNERFLLIAFYKSLNVSFRSFFL